MKIKIPAIKPDRTSFSLKPYLPGKKHIGRLKDMAQEITAASAALEGRVAAESAAAIGHHLRMINSYYSNLIEGHKTTIFDIQMALEHNFHNDPDKKYAQELCAGHVETEKALMEAVLSDEKFNICTRAFLSRIHAAFYSMLPEAHRYTHTGNGFTRIPVMPGEIRDVNVSVDGRFPHGPAFGQLPTLLDEFAQKFNPDNFHGDERLIAMAASHHRLTWLHPFRDGNGRVARLFSGLYLARAGINQRNLWSLSRGLSRLKQRYMLELWATDSPEASKNGNRFSDELSADFCEFFFTVCLDQIRFMEKLLRLDQLESRIDWYVESRSRDISRPLRPESAKLLRAVIMRGSIPRGRAGEILNMSQRSARRIVSTLIAEGLLNSESHRSSLTIGLPIHVLPYYFPDLYKPGMIGEEYGE
jgi:Fic family protein